MKKRNRKQHLSKFQESVLVEVKVEVAFIEKEAIEKESKFIKKLHKMMEIKGVLPINTWKIKCLNYNKSGNKDAKYHLKKF